MSEAGNILPAFFIMNCFFDKEAISLYNKIRINTLKYEKL